jgi:hypothetical protein
MPQPTVRHLKIVFGGALEGGGKADQWSCGLSMVGGPLFATFGLSQAFLDDISADVNTWWTAIRGQFQPIVKLSYVKANMIGANGLYEEQDKTWRKDFTPVAGSNGSNGSTPWSTAVVVSLRTNAQRGLASKGRIYLPPVGVSVLTAQGLLDPSSRATIGNTTAQLIKNLNNWPSADPPGSPRVHVVSGGGIQGGPTSREVTHLVVGDRLDTQRRRANDSLETYTRYNLP